MSEVPVAEEAQVGCNMTRDVGLRLDAYARRHGLRRPALCALLVVRAARGGRLGALKGRFAPSAPKHGSVHVVARVPREIRAEFGRIAADEGMGIDDAASAVFLEELEAGWLDRSMSQDDWNQP